MDEIIWSIICVLFYLIIKIINSKPNKIQFYFKFFMYYSYAAVVTTILSVILIWRGRDLRNGPIICKWLQPMTTFHGMTWHLENAEVLQTKGSAVIISNHQSELDLLGIFRTLPKLRKCISVAKKQVVYLGPGGLAMYLIGTLFIDRKKPEDAYSKLDKAVEMMIKEEVKIWMFPEGTRNNFENVKLLPFKKGAFKVAVAAQSPIIPIVFSPYYFTDNTKYIFDNGGHVVMRCLEPVPTKGLTMDDVPELQKRLHDIILQTYEDLCNEVPYKYPTAHSVTKES